MDVDHYTFIMTGLQLVHMAQRLLAGNKHWRPANQHPTF